MAQAEKMGGLPAKITPEGLIIEESIGSPEKKDEQEGDSPEEKREMPG